jgi:predicted ester cyclase
MPHDLRQLSRDWFDHVWNNRDDAAIRRLASSSVRCEGLGEDGMPTVGLDQFLRFRRQILDAFPDFAGTVEDVLVDGDKTAVRCSFSGTHTGPGIGMPPTGRPMKATAIVMFRWQNGQIVEAWNEFDAAGMMRQLQAPHARLKA